ncbi:MAG: hypothetical protein HFJ72_08870 [Adlercreutzia sp.]|nr:hypothetical protein [Adlercreutzia sp.]
MMTTMIKPRTFAARAAACAVVAVAAFGLAAALSAVSPATALAKTYEESWTVEFTGDKMVDEGSADITKTVAGLQPGDSASFNITLYESYDKAADWYMKNEVLSTMEETFDEVNAQGGSYSYKLTYVSPDGEEKVLLTNETVSGDAETGETNGLKDATSGVEEWFYLDTLQPEARAAIHLEVAIDGETHGNTYFDSAAALKLSFAAEPVADEPTTPAPRDPETPDQKKDEDKKKDETTDTKKDTEKEKSAGERLSQTGDLLPLGTLVVLVVVAGGVLIGVAAKRRHDSKKSEEGEAR